MNLGTRIIVGEEEYLLIKGYQEVEKYRKSLNQLTRQTFGFDFEDWFTQGLWTDRYCPYSLVHKEQVVANVSVNTMDFSSGGRLYHTLQIGTVMTEPNYRGRGLSKILFDFIMEEYEGKVELMYLYANGSVLNFYPKFGFAKAKEYIYSKEFVKKDQYAFRKLDGTKKDDRELLLRIISNAKPVSKYALVNNPYLPMFYLTAPMADNIYYCEELELVAVAEYGEEGLLIYDIFCSRDCSPEEVIPSLLHQKEGRVLLGYTPCNSELYQVKLLQEPDTTFFVKGNNFALKGRLPILSHA